MKDKICMNPDCYKNEILEHYNCGDRPLVGLAKTCWNCHKSEFLKDLIACKKAPNGLHQCDCPVGYEPPKCQYCGDVM